ncbi:MAG: hypothetical protein KJN79_09355 [Gammaproteobacteria bacterium]|nr:hypothetical protein [Gammaproteobacteria bacterium]
MEQEKLTLWGLDSPEHLRAWMEAAGRRYMVLRVADILDMCEVDQQLFLQWMTLASGGVSGPELGGAPLRAAIQGAGVNGYIRIPRDAICSLSLADLLLVQHWTSVYRDVRLGKGEPSRTDPCAYCQGTGRVNARRCRDCGGDGAIVTFLEVSDEEIALCRGREDAP